MYKENAMPKTVKKTIKKQKIVLLPPEMEIKETTTCGSSCCCGGKSIPKTGIILAILAILALGLVLVNRGLIIAAIVNGKPIFRFEVDKMLTDRFGKQTLETMINEGIIMDAAQKENIVISTSDIETKEQEIVKGFGGNITLEEVLQFQGMTKKEFDDQVKIQLLLTKILGKDIVISDQEVTEYIATNKDTLTATEEGALTQEAREALLNEKVNEKIQPWFSALREKTSIIRLMK